MTDDYHTGIRSVDDIKTAEEVFTKNNKTEYRALRKKMINDGFKPDSIDKQIRKRKDMEK